MAPRHRVSGAQVPAAKRGCFRKALHRARGPNACTTNPRAKAREMKEVGRLSSRYLGKPSKFRQSFITGQSARTSLAHGEGVCQRRPCGHELHCESRIPPDRAPHQHDSNWLLQSKSPTTHDSGQAQWVRTGPLKILLINSCFPELLFRNAPSEITWLHATVFQVLRSPQPSGVVFVKLYIGPVAPTLAPPILVQRHMR